MNSIILFKNYQSFIITLILFCSTTVFAQTGAVIQIAETKNFNATAYNNSRKIVRTSGDRRIVVFQDSLNQKPAIMWSYSGDGIQWSSPALLAYGSSPSLTIAENDWTYAVWCLENQKGIGITYLKNDSTSWEDTNLPREVTPQGALQCKYPTIETTSNSVHIVWQNKNESDFTNNILYQQFNKELSDSLTPIISLSVDSCDSKRPVIAGDLEFNIDLLHIFWTDFSLSLNNPQIMYRSIDETRGENNVIISQTRTVPISYSAFPSISVRNYTYMENALASDIVISYINKDSTGFGCSLLMVDSSRIIMMGTDSISTNKNPAPTVDDTFSRSCSIVWQDSSDIYYGQNTDGLFITLPPIPVSTINDIAKRNPNVCYKTFRRDFFDVIWTEGNSAPYKIIYRRMEKQYSPSEVQNFEAKNNIGKNFHLLQCYPNPFNNSTLIPIQIHETMVITINIYNINGNLVHTLFRNKIEPGLHNFYWNGADRENNMLSSGLYFVEVSSQNLRSIKKILVVK